ncbi:DUF11 domain-containing protein [Allorhodopirellula heiligendammensis]|uniref:DUF11 domain-containing protein n=1 Tax=Allorhodopirellula heiligendammensis TaxID=2714739 RepID=A0A5C6BZZ4_9BACT|nr:DUF11 domain-containing protein [Allorhodopirellula heiligendammensis]TWU16826.1 hypothetical protein Poly21_40330 [Allorhodopirellula heiligendammensis]
MIDIAETLKSSQATHSSTHFLALLCLACLASGCTGVPTGNLASAPGSKAPVARGTPVASPAVTAVQPHPQASSEIAQVGFRKSVHVGDDVCASNDCGCTYGPCAGGCNATPYGYVMPLVPQPWQYDPQEFLCDGGDQPPHAVLTRDDQIRGLQPQDTVTHYTTEAGDIEFTASNQVCVYAPRFGNVRRITGAIQGDGAIAVAGTTRPVGPQDVNYDLPGLVMTDSIEVGQEEFTRRIDSMRDRNRGIRIENIQQPVQSIDVRTVLAGIQNVGISELDESLLALLERYAVAATIWTLDESVEVAIEDLAPPVLTRDQKVDALVVYDFPGPGRLNLIKLADKKDAPIGDTVTFTLRLQNVGDSAVSGVVVTDNLVTRLEYVADSQSASVDAEFETKRNQAESSQLIWRLQEELAVGDSVTIEFQCRVL